MKKRVSVPAVLWTAAAYLDCLVSHKESIAVLRVKSKLRKCGGRRWFAALQSSDGRGLRLKTWA